MSAAVPCRESTAFPFTLLPLLQLLFWSQGTQGKVSSLFWSSGEGQQPVLESGSSGKVSSLFWSQGAQGKVSSLSWSQGAQGRSAALSGVRELREGQQSVLESGSSGKVSSLFWSSGEGQQSVLESGSSGKVSSSYSGFRELRGRSAVCSGAQGKVSSLFWSSGEGQQPVLELRGRSAACSGAQGRSGKASSPWCLSQGSLQAGAAVCFCPVPAEGPVGSAVPASPCPSHGGWGGDCSVWPGEAACSSLLRFLLPASVGYFWLQCVVCLSASPCCQERCHTWDETHPSCCCWHTVCWWSTWKGSFLQHPGRCSV
ncbi:uncharacterized protein LOC143695149 isoform X2 [Agelaius phoeniceus]|uniref:uncharacterized protein LOC143695149 isoform X2 n=1 Tax=Agelaius phoeniceus TaxID=39638 RepID=UPI004054F58A